MSTTAGPVAEHIRAESGRKDCPRSFAHARAVDTAASIVEVFGSGTAEALNVEFPVSEIILKAPNEVAKPKLVLKVAALAPTVSSVMAFAPVIVSVLVPPSNCTATLA